MNPKLRGLLWRDRKGVLGLASGAVALGLAASGAAQTVTQLSDAELRGAIAQGGRVVFASDGGISLTNGIVVARDTVLDGTGRQITINGGVGCLFHVSPNVTFTVVGLTLTYGPTWYPGWPLLVVDHGKAILNDGGAVNLQGVAFGGSRDYLGGAVDNQNGGTVNAANCGFSGNANCALASDSGLVNLEACSFSGNWAYGGNWNMEWAELPIEAGPVEGGAVRNAGRMTINRCAFQGNVAEAYGVLGDGVTGVPVAGGAVWNRGTLVISNSTFAQNSLTAAAGGAGGNGGAALGGALFNTGLAVVVNSTFCANTATGGAGGAGGHAGYDVGGICDASGGLTLINCTIASNQAAFVGGLDAAGSVLINTLLATNSPGANAAGAITDAGHNLSSDASCAFTNPTSLNRTDPMLGPLADNGGPTLTMALLPGSPAIDAGGPLSAPPADQRGFARPYGLAPDIGAYEAMPLYTVAVAASPATNGSVTGGGLFGLGSIATVTATPGPDFHFVGWTEQGTELSSSNPLSFVVTTDRNLAAGFASNRTDTITLSVSGARGGRVSGGGTFTNAATRTVTATPARGCLFAFWSEDGAVVSTSPRYTFALHNDRDLVATFVPNPFPAVSGTYRGLIGDGTDGTFTISVTPGGAFSGALQLRGALQLPWVLGPGSRRPVSGQFDTTGFAGQWLLGTSFSSYSLGLQLDLVNGTDHLTGSIVENTFMGVGPVFVTITPLAGDRAVYDGQTRLAPEAGNYTMAIFGDGVGATQPGGDSWGLVSVSKGGRIALKGLLADNTPVTQASLVSKSGLWPLYVPLYGGQGLLCGWLGFTNASDVGGAVTWTKTVAGAAVYPGPFSLTTQALGERYPPASKRGDVLDLTRTKGLTLALQGGALTTPVTNRLTVARSGQSVFFLCPQASLTFAPSTGVFSGLAKELNGPGAVRFSGVVLPRNGFGAGFFVDGGLSGQVRLSP
jgi:hypothetical protein